MCFSYPEADGENRSIWCCGGVQRVRSRDNKVIEAEIKLDKEFVACGESDLTKELLKENLWIWRSQRRGRGGRMCNST